MIKRLTKLPPLLLMTFLLNWFISLSGVYLFVKLYPPVDDHKFSPDKVPERLAEWRPSVEREVSLEKPNIGGGRKPV